MKTHVRAHTRTTESGKPTVVSPHMREVPEPATRKERELALWLNWKTGGEKPEDLKPLVESMMGLVNSKANVYIGKVQMPPSAIRAEFTRSLIESLKRYDPKSGAAISTYATWYLKKSQRYITTYQNTARISEERIYKIRKFKTALAELRDTLEREPTDIEVAKKLGWKEAEVALLDTELRNDLNSSMFETDPTVVMPSRDKETMKFFVYELNPEEALVYRHLLGMGKPKITDVNVLAEKLGEPVHKLYRIRNSIARKLKVYLQ